MSIGDEIENILHQLAKGDGGEGKVKAYFNTLKRQAKEEGHG